MPRPPAGLAEGRCYSPRPFPLVTGFCRFFLSPFQRLTPPAPSSPQSAPYSGKGQIAQGATLIPGPTRQRIVHRPTETFDTLATLKGGQRGDGHHARRAREKMTKQTQFRTTRPQSMGYEGVPVRRAAGSAKPDRSLHRETRRPRPKGGRPRGTATGQQ